MKKQWLYQVATITLLLAAFLHAPEHVRPSTRGTFISRATPLSPQDTGHTDESVVDGVYLKAFAVAYEDFKNDTSISAEKRVLEKYKVFFTKDKECINVLFYAKSHESEPNIKGSIDGEREYCVSSKTYAILGRTIPK